MAVPFVALPFLFLCFVIVVRLACTLGVLLRLRRAAVVLSLVSFFGSAAPAFAEQNKAVQPQWAAELKSEYHAKVSAASAELVKNADRYRMDPVAYDRYLDTHMAPLWDAASTTRALVGKTMYAQLNEPRARTLSAAVESTLRRYAFEGLKYYDGQTFSVHDVLVNQRGSRAWVQLVLNSKLLPDLYLDLMVKRASDDRWVTVDVRFKGITYVGVKKHSFRELLEDRSVEGLITSLESKNSAYFYKLCAAAKVSGLAPC